jgi:aryl-alcohol dehydrogenase-like predicted oxidoreductase
MDRREFLRATALAAVTTGSVELFAKSDGQMPKRPLGKTGERLSIFGFGGTAVMSIEQSAASRLVAEAFDRGVNYYDVSPTYENAEERLGPALEPYRKQCFLASKTDYRDAAGLDRDLNNSLKVLRTAHFDLYQHHAVDKMSDLEQIYGPGGAMEAVVAARKAGKVRFIGLSTHSVKVALSALERGGLDTLMFPINYVLFSRANVGPQVLMKANQQGLGFFAIKGMARGKYADGLPSAKRTPKCWYEPCSLEDEAALGFRWTLSKDVTAAIPPGNPKWFKLAMDVAQLYKPITDAETKRLMTFAEGADPLFSVDMQ